MINNLAVASTLEQAGQAENLRQFFALRLVGHGLEIGPMNRPLPRHSGASVDYLDILTVDEHRSLKPELRRQLLVEPHIVDDAQELSVIDDNSYDFVAAACVLAQLRNPILALKHWLRVVRPGGVLYLVISDPGSSESKLRRRCSLEHAILDYTYPSEERDYEHYLDFVSRVKGIRGVAALEVADRLAGEDAIIDFHPFEAASMMDILKWISTNVAALEILAGPLEDTVRGEFHYLVSKLPGSV